jgi:hypothetical protein
MTREVLSGSTPRPGELSQLVRSADFLQQPQDPA